MGLLSSAYYMSRMAQQYLPGIKNVVDKLLDKYVDSIDPEEWTEKVANVDTESMDYQAKKESRELAMQAAGVMGGQCDNLAQAIQEDPVTWGAYLQEKGMDSEKLDELQQKVEEEGSVPPFEIMKLTIGGSTGAETEQEAQQKAEAPGNSVVDENSGQGPVESDEEKTNRFANMADQMLGSVTSGNDGVTIEIESEIGK